MSTLVTLIVVLAIVILFFSYTVAFGLLAMEFISQFGEDKSSEDRLSSSNDQPVDTNLN